MASMWSGWKRSQTKSIRLLDGPVLSGDVLGLFRALHRVAVLTLLPRRTIKLTAIILL
jgi:hypothetical protein